MAAEHVLGRLVEWNAYAIAMEVGRLPSAQQDALLAAAVGELGAARQGGDLEAILRFDEVVTGILSAMPSLSGAQIEAVCAVCVTATNSSGSPELAAAVIQAVERGAPLDEVATAALRRLQQVLARTPVNPVRELATRLEGLIGAQESPLDAGAPFSDAMLQALTTMDPDERAAWTDFFALATRTSGSRPTARWSRSAASVVERVGRARFIDRVAAVTALVEKPKELTQTWSGYAAPITDRNTAFLVACAWALGNEGAEASAAQVLGDLCALCLTKIPGYGPISNKVGNACVTGLGAMNGLHGAAQLSRLRLRVKYAVAQRLIQRALDQAAEKNGITVADLEDLAVPSFGLDSRGESTTEIGEWTLRIRLARGPEVTWSHATKRAPKSVPADVKADPAWKQAKKTLAAIEQRMGIERSRIERFYLARRELPLATFRERFLEHPVMSTIARRLVWNVAEGGTVRQALVRSGQFVDLLKAPVTDPDARISLFHPLGATPEALAVLHDVLEDEGIVQPWKQVHREVYTLTTEEERQREADRFGGHLVRQHVFASLLHARGWQYRLMGQFDSHNTPTLALPEWGLEAQLDVDYPDEGLDATSDAGIHLHVRLGALHFGPVSLGEVPPLLFSEVMRDVDLFCSVSSVGADPRWVERNGGDDNLRLWRRQAYGALPPSAEVRRVVLRELLSRLPNPDRFELDERFLRVHGVLRRYRIHVGSGNVLVEPTDAPLVLGAAPSAGLPLPFEGDERLAAIVDTAMMLAADDRSRDPALRAMAGRTAD